MYEVKIAIKNLSSSNENEFNQAAHSFIEQLQDMNRLEVDLIEEKVENSRGVTILLTGIIVKAIELGVIAGIYTFVKDLYEKYHNAEVELTFKNGSSITLKNLTFEEAKELIKIHGKTEK